MTCRRYKMGHFRVACCFCAKTSLRGIWTDDVIWTCVHFRANQTHSNSNSNKRLLIITCFQLKVFACRLILKRGAHSEMVFSHKVTWSSENRFGRAEIYHQPVKEIATDLYITATSLIMCAGHHFVTDPRIPLPPVSLWAPTLNLMHAKVPRKIG